VRSVPWTEVESRDDDDPVRAGGFAASLDVRGAALPPNPNRKDPSADGLRPDEFADRLGKPLVGLSSLGSTRFDHREPSMIIGVAPHWSHRIRDEVEPKLLIDDALRLYDEDPYTERFLGPFATVLSPNQSRYEVDVNRPPDLALYTHPDRAWGQWVWGDDLDRFERERSLELWYEFHHFLDAAVVDAIGRFGRAVLFDIHSYNYQRSGRVDWRDDPAPTINLGSAHLRLDEEGEEILEWIRRRLDAFTVLGEECTFGENDVFYGGYINRRMSRTYGPRCITVSVEFKKVFMDERAGELHEEILDDLVRQMNALVHDLGEELGQPVRRPAKVPEVFERGD
jgi:N-formylglutamate amidohydrolase